MVNLKKRTRISGDFFGENKIAHVIWTSTSSLLSFSVISMFIFVFACYARHFNLVMVTNVN